MQLIRPDGACEGTEYEIDLNAKNAAAFRKQLATYIEHAARPGGHKSAGPGGPRSADSARVISGPGRRSAA
jgi:Lsr2